MPPVRLTLLAPLVVALALFAAQPAAAASLPLDVRPAQGPSGSSAILSAPGFAAEEDVDVVLDGSAVAATGTTFADGTFALSLAMPTTAGVHRIVLQGKTSKSTASGTFTTTASGARRPTMLAAPRPLTFNAGAPRPWLADVFAVNFSASAALTMRCPCEADGSYSNFDFNQADASGNAFDNFDFDIGDYGVIDLALSEGAGLGGAIVAADAVMKAVPAYDANRRLRVIPPVGGLSSRMYVVGSGFPANAKVAVDEDGVAVGDVTADGRGGVVAVDDDGPNDEDNPTTATKLSAGGTYGASSSARSAAGTPPTAGVTHDLLPAGARTRVVGAGLPGATPVAVIGLDAVGVQTVLGTGTTRADGSLDPVTVTLPGSAAAGPYRLEIDAASTAAFTSLALDGAIDPVQATTPKSVTGDTDAGSGTNGTGSSDNGGSGSTGGGSSAAKIGLTLPKKLKLKAFGKGGVKAIVDLAGLSCAPSCSLAASLKVGKPAAKKLGITGKGVQVVIARAKAKSNKRINRVTLKLGKKAAKRLGKLRTLQVTVGVEAVDGSAKRGAAEKKLTLKR